MIFCTFVIMKSIFFLLVLLPNVLHAQWQPANGPYGGMIWDLKNNTQAIFATQSNGVFRSTDGGGQWTKCDTARAHHLTVHDEQVTLVSYAHYFLRRSTDGGHSWTTRYLPDDIRFMRDWAEKDSIILISANKYLWRSIDGGSTWASQHIAGATDHLYDAVEIISGQFYVSDHFNIFRSSDGLHWTALTSVPEPLPFRSVFQLYGHDTTLLAFTGPRLFRSGDGGKTWKEATVPPGTLGPLPPNFTRTESRWYAASGRLLVSNDAGISWVLAAGNEAAPPDLWAVAQWRDTVILASQTNGAFQTQGDGFTLIPANRGLSGSMVVDVATTGDTVYTFDNQGISRTLAPGFNWDTAHLYPAHTVGTTFSDVKIHQGILFVRQSGGELMRSKNGGKTWQIASPPSLSLPDFYFRMESKNDTLFLLEATGKLWYTHDLGNTWHLAPLPGIIEDIAVQNASVFMVSDAKIYRSLDGTTSWTLVSNSPGTAIRLFAVRSCLLSLVSGNSPELFVSSDEGQSWQPCDIAWPSTFQGQREQRVNFFQFGTVLIGSFEGGGVFISRDSGLYWDAFDQGLPAPTKIFELTANAQWLLTGTGEGLFFRPTTSLNVLALKEPFTDHQMVVFQNPVETTFLIKNKSATQIAMASIMDAQGRVLLQKALNSANTDEVALSVASLLPGSYFLRLIWRDGMEKTYKFIKVAPE